MDYALDAGPGGTGDGLAVGRLDGSR